MMKPPVSISFLSSSYAPIVRHYRSNSTLTGRKRKAHATIFLEGMPIIDDVVLTFVSAKDTTEFDQVRSTLYLARRLSAHPWEQVCIIVGDCFTFMNERFAFLDVGMITGCMDGQDSQVPVDGSISLFSCRITTMSGSASLPGPTGIEIAYLTVQ
jgi:hypothetical protein